MTSKAPESVISKSSKVPSSPAGLVKPLDVTDDFQKRLNKLRDTAYALGFDWMGILNGLIIATEHCEEEKHVKEYGTGTRDQLRQLRKDLESIGAC